MKTICIVVPELKDERAAAEAHFRERGVPVEFVNGIHGVTSGLMTKFPYDYDHPGTNFNVGQKIISLAINHYVVWSACMLLPDETFLILEADANFPEGWQAKFNQALLDVPPDWDVLYVGSCNAEAKPMEHVKGDVYKVDVNNPHAAPHCSHAILYTKKAIRTALETQRRFYVGIDLALIFHTLPLLNVYCLRPRLITQHNPDVTP